MKKAGSWKDKRYVLILPAIGLAGELIITALLGWCVSSELFQINVCLYAVRWMPVVAIFLVAYICAKKAKQKKMYMAIYAGGMFVIMQVILRLLLYMGYETTGMNVYIPYAAAVLGAGLLGGRARSRRR